MHCAISWATWDSILLAVWPKPIAGGKANKSIISTCRIARVSHSITLEGAEQTSLSRVLLERRNVPGLLGEEVPRGYGAASASAAHRRASFRRFRGGACLLPAKAGRGDVAAEGALRRAGVLPRLPWPARGGAHAGRAHRRRCPHGSVLGLWRGRLVAYHLCHGPHRLRAYRGLRLGR